ncbi:MAG TPA: rhodanese-like domain-containing protein [Thermoanaerobaculia bacterium]|nr:rhodanese-like domain-containing protein [Thermoanaerobaculia bacterium]
MDISAALAHFESRLEWEIDAADLWADRDTYVIVDARTPEAFAAGHVPGAINLPHRTITTVSFPKDAVLVTYCDGIGCNASTKAAVRLSRLGYRVKEMIGGIDWWRRDGLPVEGTAAAVACGC